MEFTPKKASDVKPQIKDLFLKGNIFRLDGERNEVFSRGLKDVTSISSMSNIGQLKSNEKPCLLPFHFNNSLIREVIDELKKEDYIVTSIRCTDSGCCQYTTYAYFLS